MPLNDITVTRFPNGVTNRPENDILGGSLRAMDPTRYHTFFEDFDYYTAADWTVTETQAGATQALANVDGGVLLLTNTNTEDDLLALQKVGESFLFEAGKKLFFKTRFAVSEASELDWLVGLQITDASPFDASDGVWFKSDDGDANIDFTAVKNSVAVSASAIGVIADDTYVELAFYWDGISRIYYGLNGAVLGYIEPGASLPDDEALTVSFAIMAGAAAAETMSMDYIFVAKERN